MRFASTSVLTNRRRLIVGFASLTIVLPAVLVGCGGDGSEIRAPAAEGEPVPVKGKVTLASGQGVENAVVHFTPVKEGVGRQAQGTTKADGSYELTSTGKGNDGTLPGDYNVYIEPPPKPQGAPKSYKPPFPIEYAGEDGASGLTATVKSGDNQPIDFKLSASPPKGASRGGRRGRDSD
jgi:hypothetical protein